MSDSKQSTGRKRRSSKNTFTTKSGNAIKLNRSLVERVRARRDDRARRRAAYLARLPKNRFKRILFRLNPKELARYWFSREGMIMALKITGVGLVVCFLLIVGVFAYLRKDLPNIKDLAVQTLGGSVSYYDRTGQTLLFQDYNKIKRVPVATDKMAKTIRDATVAIEDKDFYKHGAFDIRGIVRAGVNNLFKRGGATQGGSTISQQFVKIDSGWTFERTIGHKIKEVILAVEVEREYSKEDILTGYLNTVPYGGVAVGVQVAAQDYFGVDAKDLTIAQAAMLASIPQAPSTYSPHGLNFDGERLIGRQQYVIDQMVKQKMITKQEGDEAKKVDILAQVKPKQASLYTGIKAPYFVLSARAELEDTFTAKIVQQGGWKVITTVDLDLQKIAEDQVQKGMKQVRNQGGDSAAFVAEDVKTGQVVALVGGADFTQTKYGEINFAQRQLPPGSSFKPYDYAALIENSTNAGAGSVLYDVKQPLTGWSCTIDRLPKNGGNCLDDYDHRYPGPVTLRYGLGGSRNVPAVKAMLTIGPSKTIDTAESMGLVSGYRCYQPGDVDLTKELPCYGSSAIGDGAYLRMDEHVNGYATLSRMGSYIPRTYILKVTDSANKTIKEWKQPEGKQAIRPDTAYIVTDMMKDPNASYMSRKIHRFKGWEFAVKTGTTNDAKDGWMMGFSSRYAAGVWVGVHDREHTMGGFMETMTTPIWNGWMQAAHDKLDPVGWTKPSGVKTLPAYVVTEHVGTSSREPSPKEDLYPSWYQPPKTSSTPTSEDIDVVSNKAATSCTPDLAKKKTTGSNANKFSIDIFWPIKGGSSTNADTGTNDDVHNCNDTKPSVTLTAPETCSDEDDCIFTVTVSKGTHPLSGGSYTASPAGTVTMLVNGQIIGVQGVPTESNDLWSYSFSYEPTAEGAATLEAQVVDSVLYSSSQSGSIEFTGP